LEKVFNIIKMEINNTKENGKRVKQMDKVFNIMKMEIKSMKGNRKMV